MTSLIRLRVISSPYRPMPIRLRTPSRAILVGDHIAYAILKLFILAGFGRLADKAQDTNHPGEDQHYLHEQVQPALLPQHLDEGNRRDGWFGRGERQHL